MARASSKSDEAYTAAAEYLCLHAASLRASIGDEAWGTAIAAYLDAAPGSGPWRDALRAVHDAAEEAEIPGGIGLRFTMGPSFPSPPPPRLPGWECPSGRCGRVVLRNTAGPDAPAPVCGLSGQPMRPVE